MSRALSVKETRWISADWRRSKPLLLVDLRLRGLPDAGMVVTGLEQMHFDRAAEAFMAGLSTYSIIKNVLADPRVPYSLYRSRLQLAIDRSRYTKQHKVAKRMAGGHTHG